MGRRAISRAFSMERRLENTRSWKRCSVGSSNNNARIRSLERGDILCRLNHELLPEPGRPIAKTTTPFGVRGGGIVSDMPEASGAAGVNGALCSEADAGRVCASLAATNWAD